MTSYRVAQAGRRAVIPAVLIAAVVANVLATAFGARALLKNPSNFSRMPVVAAMMQAADVDPRTLSPDYIRISRHALAGADVLPSKVDIDVEIRKIPLLSNIDVLEVSGSQPGRIGGWVLPADAGQRVVALLIFVGGKTVAVGAANQGRPDVVAALGRPDAKRSGFSMKLPPISEADRCAIGLLMVLDTAEASKIPLPLQGCD